MKENELQALTKGKLNNLHVFVRGKHLYMGPSDKAVKYAATTDKHFGSVLTGGAERKQFGKADVVFQMGTVVWGKVWEENLKQARRVFGDKMNDQEKAMGEKIVKSMEAIRFGLAGIAWARKGCI